MGGSILVSTMTAMTRSWSSLVVKGLYLPNCQSNFVIALYILSLLFFKLINTTAYHLGRYKPSSPVSCRTPRPEDARNVQCWKLKKPQIGLVLRWVQMTRADVIARFIPNRIQVHNLFNGLYTHSLRDPKEDKLYAKSPNGYKGV